MKEKREENENIDDEDNERLTPIQFESFNVSLSENEFQIPQKKTNLDNLFINDHYFYYCYYYFICYKNL